jgi:hypothetical protein
VTLPQAGETSSADEPAVGRAPYDEPGEAHDATPVGDEPVPDAPSGWVPHTLPSAAMAPKRHVPKLLVAGLVALVLVVGVACGVVLYHGGKRSAVTASVPSTVDSSPAPSPSPVPATPAAYQTELTSIDTTLTPLVSAVDAAANANTVQSSALELVGEVDARRAEMQALAPPPATATAHTALIAALMLFRAEAEKVGTLGRTHALCTGPTAMSELTGSVAAGSVRTAAQQMATVDPAHAYRVGGFLPAPVAEPVTSRPANGALVKKPAHTGPGQLKIQNAAVDASISLVPQDGVTATLSVYVRGGASYTVHGVPDGTYLIYFMSGASWDPARKMFGKGCEFDQLANPMAFKTTSTRYSIWTIELTPVEGGNDPIGKVDPGLYPTS